jgi:TetR/AcrR family transcriptional repressor of mexJK operon
VTTDQIAARAAVSKSTIYKSFATADDILRAVVDLEVDSFGGGSHLTFATKDGFIAELARYGTNLLSFLNTANAIRFAQLGFEAVRQHPDIARLFYTTGYDRAQREIAAMIADAIRLGIVPDTVDAWDAAEDFAALLEGFGTVRSQLGVTELPFPDPKSRANLMAMRFVLLFS